MLCWLSAFCPAISLLALHLLTSGNLSLANFNAGPTVFFDLLLLSPVFEELIFRYLMPVHVFD